jgi:colicin import membrane protein
LDTTASSGFGHAGKMRPRGADGWVPGTVLAIGVHLMLVAALALSVKWKIDSPEVIEAEVWSEIPQAAAPVDLPPPPPLEAPQPVVRTETPREEEAAPPRETIPDLVVAPKPKKDEKKKPKREPVEVFESTPPKPIKPVKKPEKIPEKVPEKPPVKKAETPPLKKPIVPPAKPVTSKVTSPEGTATAAAEREAQRNERLQRMMNDLGGLGTSQSSGPSASYAGRIRARIQPRIVYTDSISGNRPAVVEVRCAPDGRIISRKLIESSGIPRWDEAVLRAIDRTEVLPADENGKVLPSMEISFRPSDL